MFANVWGLLYICPQMDKKFIILLVLAAVFAGCATTTEEHITAQEGQITFDRVVGKRAASGGFTISKDSLTLKPIN